MTTVSVVIPYFQRREGILRRALNSVLQQHLPPDIQIYIIVIDDGSPIRATAEIEGLAFIPPYHLKLIEQPNGGVADARNAGLRNVPEETTYIAFLDSDDMWGPEHISHAISVLNTGYDFYFCDSQRIGNEQARFSEKSFENFLSSAYSKPIGSNFYDLEKKAFFDNSFRSRAFLIPAVVYRRLVAPDLMFDSSLTISGEDCLFLFQLINKCQRICCSSQLWVSCGDGVNIYSGASGWDNPRNLIQHMGHLLAFYKWQKILSLSSENEHFLVNRIKNVRKLFAFLTIRYFLKKRKLWSPELVKLTRNDPMFWRWYPLYVFYVTIFYPMKLYNPLQNW